EFAPMETQEREQLPGSRQPLHQKLLLARHLGAGIPSARRHSSTEARPRGWQYPRQYMITYDHAWPQPRSRLFSRTFKLIGALGPNQAIPPRASRGGVSLDFKGRRPSDRIGSGSRVGLWLG